MLPRRNPLDVEIYAVEEKLKFNDLIIFLFISASNTHKSAFRGRKIVAVGRADENK
jgi:hypothetical protein